MFKVPDMRFFFEIDLFGNTYLVLFTKQGKDLKLDITSDLERILDTFDSVEDSYTTNLSVN